MSSSVWLSAPPSLQHYMGQHTNSAQMSSSHTGSRGVCQALQGCSASRFGLTLAIDKSLMPKIVSTAHNKVQGHNQHLHCGLENPRTAPRTILDCGWDWGGYLIGLRWRWT